MIKKINGLLFALLVMIPSVIVFVSFFKPLHLAWGDAPFYSPESLKELFAFPSVWSQKGINFGGQNLALWLSPLMVFYGALNKYLGLTNDIIVRILFYFPSVIFAGLGSFLLARYFKLSKIGQFFSSFIYLLNTYFLLLIDGGQVGIALAYGIFPFMILLWATFFDRLSIRRYFFALFATIFLCFVDPRVAVIGLILIFLLQILKLLAYKDFLHGLNLIWLVLGGIFLIPVNIYWVLPLIKGGFTGIATSVTDLRLSSLLNALTLFAPNWPSNIFGKTIQPYFYFSLTPVFIFGGFLFKKTRKIFYFLALIFLFFAFFSKGSTPPLGNIYEFLINKVPFGSVFRDSSKFFIPLFLIGGILIGNTIDLVLSLKMTKKVRIFVLITFYSYFLLTISPALLGNLNFNLSARKESADIETVYNKLKEDSGSFKTLWFNEKPQTAFETSEKPALSANQLVGFRPFASMNVGEDAYNFLNNPNFTDWLKVLGVKYLILFGDSRNIYPTEKDNKNWQTINDLVSKTPVLKKVDWGTGIPVYKIEDARPEVYSLKKIALVVGSDLANTDSIPAAIYAEDGKYNPEILEKTSPDSLEIVMNQGNKTDLAMSFLQNYFKSSKDASVSQWSVFNSGDYLKYKYELLIRGYKYQDFDYNKGMAFSTQKGEKIKFTFDIPADGNYIIAKRSGNTEKQKLSWNFEKRGLKAGDFEYEMENNSGLETLNTIAVIPEEKYDEANKKAANFILKFGSQSHVGRLSLVWHKVEENTVTHEYKITSGDRWLIYTQNYDKNWTSDISDVHIPVFSMINGFYVDQSDKIAISFAGQKYLKTGIKISLGSILALLVSYLAYEGYNFRRRNSQKIKN